MNLRWVGVSGRFLTADQLMQWGLAVLKKKTQQIHTPLETEKARGRTELVGGEMSQGREFLKFLSMSGP